MVLSDNEQFLNELTKLFHEVKSGRSLYLTMKKYDGRRKPIPASDPVKRATRARAAAKSKDKKVPKEKEKAKEKKQPKKAPAVAGEHARPSSPNAASLASASASSASGASTSAAGESGATGPHTSAQSQALVAACAVAAEAGEPLCLLRARVARKRKLATVVLAHDVNKFQLAYSAVLKSGLEGLRKAEKASKAHAKPKQEAQRPPKSAKLTSKSTKP